MELRITNKISNNTILTFGYIDNLNKLDRIFYIPKDIYRCCQLHRFITNNIKLYKGAGKVNVKLVKYWNRKMQDYDLAKHEPYRYSENLEKAIDEIIENKYDDITALKCLFSSVNNPLSDIIKDTDDRFPDWNGVTCNGRTVKYFRDSLTKINRQKYNELRLGNKYYAIRFGNLCYAKTKLIDIIN